MLRQFENKEEHTANVLRTRGKYNMLATAMANHLKHVLPIIVDCYAERPIPKIILKSKGEVSGFTSLSTLRVIYGPVHSIVTCWGRTHREVTACD